MCPFNDVILLHQAHTIAKYKQIFLGIKWNDTPLRYHEKIDADTGLYVYRVLSIM